MPRPTDHYTHAQFEPVDSDFLGDTVRCTHCKNWSGSVKTLGRKKEHLLKCPAYAAWRADGNGQDLAPPNKYQKRDSAFMNDADPFATHYSENTPTIARSRTLDVTNFFDEFWDDTLTQKCMRTRCRYCGFSRAKNTTRQFEHVQQCQEFLRSTEGQEAVAEGLLTMQPPSEGRGNSSGGKSDIFRGRAPNPTFPRLSGKATNVTPVRPGAPPRPSPSLVNHLLTKNRATLEQTTQLSFLSHAGCGTLSSPALQQWLAQQGHMSRTLCTFIGILIGKVRLSDTLNPSNDSSWRTLDLLVSALNNAKRELEFLRSTHLKYYLQHDVEPPKPATKGFLDLFASVSSPSSSLLEGLVVLWAMQHLYFVSWQYAANFIQSAAPSSTSYTVPSYLRPGHYDMPNTYGSRPINGIEENIHIMALHEALIPNWTSTGFIKFVEACKSIVDELANAQTTGNGAVELSNCEANFKQALWLWRQIFPEVTGMGDKDEPADDDEGSGQQNESGDRVERPIEIPDNSGDDHEDDAPTAGSPYDGTTLTAVAAANRSV